MGILKEADFSPSAVSLNLDDRTITWYSNDLLLWDNTVSRYDSMVVIHAGMYRNFFTDTNAKLMEVLDMNKIGFFAYDVIGHGSRKDTPFVLSDHGAETAAVFKQLKANWYNNVHYIGNSLPSRGVLQAVSLDTLSQPDSMTLLWPMFDPYSATVETVQKVLKKTNYRVPFLKHSLPMLLRHPKISDYFASLQCAQKDGVELDPLAFVKDLQKNFSWDRYLDEYITITSRLLVIHDPLDCVASYKDTKTLYGEYDDVTIAKPNRNQWLNNHYIDIWGEALVLNKKNGQNLPPRQLMSDVILDVLRAR